MKKLILIFIALTALLTSCFFVNHITGSGYIISEDVYVGTGYDTVEFNAIGEVILTNDPVDYVTLVGDDNIVAEIDVYASGDTLYIETASNTCFSSFTLTMYVPEQVVDTIISNGVGDMSADHIISASSFALVNAGVGDIELTVSAGSCGCELSGTGNTVLSGSAGSLSADLSGTGNIEAEDLLADSCNINLSGVGNIEISVQNSITGVLSGVGNLFYWGNPPTSNVQVTGVGNVYHM